MPRFHQVLVLTAVLTTIGCGPSQADIDRANKLNAQSEQRAAQEALKYLDEQDAERAADDSQGGEDGPATTESSAGAESEK